MSNNNQLYKNKCRIVCSFCRIRCRHEFRPSVASANANKRAAFWRKKGKKKRDIFGNTEKKSLLWIGRLTNSTIVLKSRSSRFPFSFFRVSPPFSPLSSLTSSLRFSHRLGTNLRLCLHGDDRRLTGWSASSHHRTHHACACVRASCRYETTCGVVWCVCVCLWAPSRPCHTKGARARALVLARACVTPSIRTGIRRAFFHFFIATEACVRWWFRREFSAAGTRCARPAREQVRRKSERESRMIVRVCAPLPSSSPLCSEWERPPRGNRIVAEGAFPRAASVCWRKIRNCIEHVARGVITNNMLDTRVLCKI